MVQGAVDSVLIPGEQKPCRTDGLWQTTCFEMFLGSADGSYFEYNYSPSRQWAAYEFASYREGMTELEVDGHPQVVFLNEGDHLILPAHIAWLKAGEFSLGLSAVIEETNGTKSYWALAHPPGQPDFHHPTCFAATLPAPDEP